MPKAIARIVRRESALKIYLALLWLVCLYRAITQSIVHDEALTYQIYLAGPAARIFDLFSANHHFLNTLLMKLSVSTFGLSEWSMRLPALAGAALYFAAVYRISTREFRSALASWLAAGLLTLNPFTLDFMVAARGYGMGLALLLWALAVLLSYSREPDHRPGDLLKGGLALGLAVAANLIFVVPATLLVALTPLLPKGQRPAGIPAAIAGRGKKIAHAKQEKNLSASFWLHFALPAICVVVLLFLLAPLSNVISADLYVGASSFRDSLRNLVDVCVNHASSGPANSVLAYERDAIAFGFVPAVLLAAVFVGLRRGNPLLLLVSGTAIGSAVVLLSLHLAMKFPYPVDRTGIYFACLVPLALIGLAEAGLAGNALAKTAGTAGFSLSALLVLQFLLQFNTGFFWVWRYDADTRRIIGQISSWEANKRHGSVQVRSPWQLEPSLNFYHDRNHLTWMQPATREPLAAGADYYVLIPQDRSAEQSLRLKQIYEGSISGTVLAIPSK